MKTINICFVLAFLLTASRSFAAETRTEDEQAIRKSAAAYVTAFNAGDAAALAELWAEDAEYISADGQRFQGREAIKKELSQLVGKGEQGVLSIDEPTIRFVSNDVAVEEGTATVIHDGQEPEKTTYLAMHVKKDGVWKIHTIRETAVAPAASGRNYPYLQEIEWLVGQWGDESDDADAQCRFAWTKNRSFISGHFRVSSDDGDDLEGTQVIGWDPATNVIRSWMFDSDGGFGAGTWTRQDNMWTVEFRQVLSDGRIASATNIYTLDDENTFHWQSVKRIVDGSPLEDGPSIKVVRKVAAAISDTNVKKASAREPRSLDVTNPNSEQGAKP